ncbi:MAG: type II toxin-antitoxin system RelE/ParE family toxin [Alphaproteobacteria bacterium]
MRPYKLSEVAAADLVQIYQWGVLRYGIEKADVYFVALFEAFESIATAPLSYASVAHIRAGYRRCVCGANSIYYCIVDETVEIMAVLGKQDAENLL